jgi:hypothetical protein
VRIGDLVTVHAPNHETPPIAIVIGIKGNGLIRVMFPDLTVLQHSAHVLKKVNES